MISEPRWQTLSALMLRLLPRASHLLSRSGSREIQVYPQPPFTMFVRKLLRNWLILKAMGAIYPDRRRSGIKIGRSVTEKESLERLSESPVAAAVRPRGR